MKQLEKGEQKKLNEKEMRRKLYEDLNKEFGDT
jgi:hypothetical protein